MQGGEVRSEQEVRIDEQDSVKQAHKVKKAKVLGATA
jgi:hypothetical protein